uniref:Eukaryotic translation initiation factor 3 subunit G n=1 Tax=Steinernema glaseri TaxID=37863 RepID=A0A1I7ZP16_9BILA
MAVPTTALPALSTIGSWAEAVENDVQGRQEITKDGITTVTQIIEEKDGKYKVITKFQTMTKKVPKEVAARKEWKKFGACKNDGAGPQLSTTYVAEEIQMQFTRNRAGEQQLETEERKAPREKGATRPHCRYCKADDHWSVQCPYKEMYARDEDKELEADASKDMAGRPNKYVPPSARGDRGVGPSGERRCDDYTCRVTNLPEDYEANDLDLRLRDMFNACGKIDRIFLARDKNTGRPKGFAFVTYFCREDAERAIGRYNGAKLDHLILKVEWAKPSNN